MCVHSYILLTHFYCLCVALAPLTYVLSVTVVTPCTCYDVQYLLFVTVLGFHVTGGSWVLEVGQTYEITVQVYDQKNHGLFIAEVCVCVCACVRACVGAHTYVCACVVLYVHEILTHEKHNYV